MSAYIAAFSQTVPAPTDLTATLTGTTKIAVSLEWQYPTVTTPVKFLVYRKLGGINDSGKFVLIYTTTVKKYVDNSVAVGKKYSYYVVAKVGLVSSDPSNKVEVLITPPVILYGKVFGQLLEDGTNAPIVKGSVKFIPVQQNLPSILAVTDSFGNFGARLLAGQYYMYFFAKGYISEYYDNVPNIQQATSITVNANDSLTYQIGLAKYLPPVTYTLTGTVKDEANNIKMATINLYFVNKRPVTDPKAMSLTTRTDSLGNFSFKGLLQNDTVVLYITPFDKSFKTQYYDQKATFAEADKIVVNGNVTGINVVLQPKPVYNNGISGFVKDSAGVTGLKGVVYAYFKTNTGYQFYKLFAKTDTLTGEYNFTNLVPGQYILLATARGFKPTYFRYDGTPTLDWRQADSVVVGETGVVSGINFNLRPCIYIMPSGSSAPFVLGYIKNNAGNTVDYALTYIVDANNEIVSASVTDLDGGYFIDGLSAGSYSLVTNAISYEEKVITSINIDDNNTGNQVDVVLNPSSVTSVSYQPEVVNNFSLSQNYPNPFNPTTKIAFSLPKDGMVSLIVYNAIGQRVATLVNGNMKAGNYEVNFDGSRLTSGIYFYSLKSEGATITKKMMLVK